MSAMGWSDKQWQAYHNVVQWSQSSASYEGVKKLLSDAGIPIKSLTSLKIFNIQNSIAYAIRRGAIRVLNEEINDSDLGEY